MSISMQGLNDAIVAIIATVGIAVALSIAFAAAGAFAQRGSPGSQGRARHHVPAQHPTQTDDAASSCCGSQRCPPEYQEGRRHWRRPSSYVRLGCIAMPGIADSQPELVVASRSRLCVRGGRKRYIVSDNCS